MIEITWLAAAGAGVGAVAGMVSALIATRSTEKFSSHYSDLTRAIQARSSLSPVFDVFLSYASDDADFAETLKVALTERGVLVWDARDQVQLGDRITDKIGDGLANSRHSVVIISPAFLRRDWPRLELRALRQTEKAREHNVLPIWDNVNAKDIQRILPPLTDIAALHKEHESVDQMADKIAHVIDAS